jgi:hypothetical protein
MKGTTIIISYIMLIVMILSAVSCRNNQNRKPTEAEITDSYVYLLGRTLAVRQELMDFNKSELPYNTIKYNEAGKADFVNPNFDVAYMEAWFAIDENSAIILNVPEIKNRHYTVQLLDGWGEALVNINERNFPYHPFGKFALCLDNTKAKIPTDAVKVMMPVKKIKMLARVELQNTWNKAVELQKEFKATVIGTPFIEPAIQFPMFTNEELPDINVFKVMNELVKTPDTKFAKADSVQDICKKVATYITESEANADSVKKIIRTKSIPTFMSYYLSKEGKFENGWLAGLYFGEYNGNFWIRTAANFVGIWANSPKEAIYFGGWQDSDGQPLGRGETYLLHFDKDQLPAKSVNAYWSVILVRYPDYRVVPNELNRFNFNNYSDLVYEKDGSLNIYISPKYNKEWHKSNWLPSPSEQEFMLTLRMYVPKDNVRAGEWFPPAITKLEKPNHQYSTISNLHHAVPFGMVQSV